MMLLAAGLVLLTAGCGDDEDTTVSTEVNLSTVGSLGSILVGGNGNTLYFFTRDTKGESNCGDGCTSAWPVFYAENIQVGSGLDAADFGEIVREDDEKQTTYKGWPLYYFSPTGDGVLESAGETSGDGANNVWFAAKPDYSLMLANAQLVGADGSNYTSTYTEGEEETQYFVDSEGRTIYLFASDYAGINNFTAADLSNNGVWPIFHDELGAVPSSVEASDFSTITVHGEQQLTYKGWPLYYFGQDTERGDNKGVSVPNPGVWPIVNTETEEAPEPPANVLITVDDVHGEIITDGDGVSLYFFTRDADGTNHCTGGCENFWPIFYEADIRLEESSALDANDFGVITLSDGTTKQTTYKGWPVYYFAPAGDQAVEAAGEVGGDDFNKVWYVAKEDYGMMIADDQLVGLDGQNYTADYTVGEAVTTYFTDAEGNTIYIFVNDTKDDNNFTDPDFGNNGVWPIYYVNLENYSVPKGMSKADFGEIDVFGQKQSTFKGWPLYYFGQDSERGDTKGVSVPNPGVWPIINNNTTEAQ